MSNDASKIARLWNDRDKPLNRKLIRAYLANLRPSKSKWVPLNDMPALVAKYWSNRDHSEFTGPLTDYVTLMLADISD
jgi:hypothetical protein